MRFLTPIVFALAAGWVAWYNGQHADRAVILPFMDLIDPGADMKRQGELTVMVLGALAVVLTIWEGLRLAKSRTSA